MGKGSAKGVRPEIAGGRTLSKMLRGGKGGVGKTKQGRKKVWYTPATEDIRIAERLTNEGTPTKLPAKVAKNGHRFFKFDYNEFFANRGK